MMLFRLTSAGAFLALCSAPSFAETPMLAATNTGAAQVVAGVEAVVASAETVRSIMADSQCVGRAAVGNAVEAGLCFAGAMSMAGSAPTATPTVHETATASR